MAKVRIPGLRNASAKEVRELSKLPWTHDEALSVDGSPGRILSDGRVLVFFETQWERHALPIARSRRRNERRWTRRGRAGQEPEGVPSIPARSSSPIDDFLRDVEAHAKSLGPRLRMPDEVLDGTQSSLDAVDKALKRIPWVKRPVPDLLTPSWPTSARCCEEPAAASGRDGRRRENGRYASSTRPSWKCGEEPRSACTPPRPGLGRKSGPGSRIQEHMPKPRLDVVDEPIRGHENKPMITASGGQMSALRLGVHSHVRAKQADSAALRRRHRAAGRPTHGAGPARPMPMMITLVEDPAESDPPAVEGYDRPEVDPKPPA